MDRQRIGRAPAGAARARRSADRLAHIAASARGGPPRLGRGFREGRRRRRRGAISGARARVVAPRPTSRAGVRPPRRRPPGRRAQASGRRRRGARRGGGRATAGLLSPEFPLSERRLVHRRERAALRGAGRGAVRGLGRPDAAARLVAPRARVARRRPARADRARRRLRIRRLPRRSARRLSPRARRRPGPLGRLPRRGARAQRRRGRPGDGRTPPDGRRQRGRGDVCVPVP